VFRAAGDFYDYDTAARKQRRTDLAQRRHLRPAGGPGKSPDIDRNEAIKLNGDLVSVDQLTARLETLRRDRPDAAVLIRPHKELSVQKLIAVMDCLQRAKIGKVGIATQQGEGNAP
jgi:biopolymer transport protein ExbD